MPDTLNEIFTFIHDDLPDDYVICSDDDALIKSAFITEELGEVVKAIAHGDKREVVKECSDTIIGLLQVMDHYNDRGEEGITSAFHETLSRIHSKRQH